MKKHLLICLAIIFVIQAKSQTIPFTWMGGNNTINNIGIYGTKGVANASNMPGTRTVFSSWKDNSGNFWLFGGVGCDGMFCTQGELNDLWKYNVSSNQWAWMAGSKFWSSFSNYGIKGVTSPNNVPSARQESIKWTDNSGNLWLYGGWGFSQGGGINPGCCLSDLWKYDITSNTNYNY